MVIVLNTVDNWNTRVSIHVSKRRIDTVKEKYKRYKMVHRVGQELGGMEVVLSESVSE